MSASSRLSAGLSLMAVMLLAACSRSEPPVESVAAPEDPAGVTASAGWSRATPAGGTVGAAYLELRNDAAAADELVSVETPVAGRVEIHDIHTENGVMQMHKLDTLPLPTGETIKLAPGGLHIMLLDLKAPLAQGSSYPLTLKFKSAASVTVKVDVGAIDATSPPPL